MVDPGTSHKCMDVIEVDDIETKQEFNFWIPELNLFQSDKEILLSDQWLNDNIICAAQTLLKRQSKMHGWMSTELVSAYSSTLTVCADFAYKWIPLDYSVQLLI